MLIECMNDCIMSIVEIKDLPLEPTILWKQIFLYIGGLFVNIGKSLQ